MDPLVVDEDKILQRFDNLVESGIVLYDNQEVVTYCQDGFQFRFLVAHSLKKKPLAHGPAGSLPNGEAFKAGADKDEVVAKENGDKEAAPAPLLEPGSDISVVGYEICDIGPAHRLIANKFCYARPMLLLLTRDGYKRQYDPLEASDFEAAWAVLRAVRSDHLVFYNCGEPSGNSRLHRHIQILPRPEGFRTFLDDDKGEAAGGSEGNQSEQPRVPFLYFRQAVGGADGDGDKQLRRVTGEALARVYGELRRRAEAASTFRWDGPGTDCPHHLVMTRRWMAVIPRRRAVWEGLSTNAAGMLGIMGVASREEADRWIRLGPIQVLEQLGISDSGS